MSNDYKEDIAVDFFRLHENWRDQASNYMEWGEKWANAVKKKDQYRRSLSIKIRLNPTNYGLSANPSEASIKATIEDDERYIELTADVNILQTAKEAFLQRRSSLDGLTKLYLNGYFTEAPPETKTIRQDLKREQEQRVGKAQHDALQNSNTKKRIGGKRDGQ